VKLLLTKKGVNPDSKDTKYGGTLLSWASEKGHEAVVKLLLAMEGVDPNSKDNNSRTPLSWAAANGHNAVLKLLAKEGVVGRSFTPMKRHPSMRLPAGILLVQPAVNGL
jgi:ankyrin repeat protein